MATSYIVFAILCSTALGEFDVENLPAMEPTSTTEGAKLDDAVKDSSRTLEGAVFLCSDNKSKEIKIPNMLILTSVSSYLFVYSRV